MKKIHSIYIGAKNDLQHTDESWAFVHACKSSHRDRLDYTNLSQSSPYYFLFKEKNHLYLNWVDDLTGKYFQIATFTSALDFIDRYIKTRKVFVHCDLGSSRGPTMGFVYLAKRTSFLSDNFEQALEEFQQKYPYYSPGGILLFVKENWNKIQ